MNKENLKIELKNTSDLINYANNAKQHSDHQIDKIAASIKEFGFNNPILADDEMVIIAGHGRLAAAKKLGLKKVPVLTLSHLSEAQKKAYILADNRLGEVGTSWDLDVLAIEIETLKEFDVDIDLLGFDNEFLSQFNDQDLDFLSDDEINDACNVLIKCQNQSEKEFLLKRLGLKSEKLTASQVLELWERK